MRHVTLIIMPHMHAAAVEQHQQHESAAHLSNASHIGVAVGNKMEHKVCGLWFVVCGLRFAVYVFDLHVKEGQVCFSDGFFQERFEHAKRVGVWGLGFGV